MIRALPAALGGLLLLLAVPARPAAPGAGPVLEVTRAVYRADKNVLEFAFTFRNPGDTALFLDCEIQPVASRRGRTLRLDFARVPGADSLRARPQRVGARQGYQGHRRIHGLGPDTLGAPAHPADPAEATLLEVAMSAYPERMEGEGEPWVAAQGKVLEARPAALARKGKRARAMRTRIRTE